jgi:hypothetical protein
MFISTNSKSGLLKADAAGNLAKMGLRVIEAPQTAAIPPQYRSPLLGGSGA